MGGLLGACWGLAGGLLGACWGLTKGKSGAEVGVGGNDKIVKNNLLLLFVF